MRIISSKKQSAKRGGMSVRHLERLIADGEGPPLIRLGTRKIGIADDDFDAWLASRRVVPPGWRDSAPSVPTPSPAIPAAPPNAPLTAARASGPPRTARGPPPPA
jgi:predicted DNA-binding transcriptional regulator AlpA